MAKLFSSMKAKSGFRRIEYSFKVAALVVSGQLSLKKKNSFLVSVAGLVEKSGFSVAALVKQNMTGSGSFGKIVQYKSVEY